MGLFKVHDRMCEVPPYIALSAEAWRTLFHALCYASRNGTDGDIPARSFKVSLRRGEHLGAAASELVDTGVWEATLTGWRFAGYELDRHYDGMWITDGWTAIRPSWWTPSRPSLPPGLRAEILERDNYTCQYCGATDILEVDHIYPLSKGGLFDDPENLQVLCRPCNRRKSAKVVVVNGVAQGRRQTSS